MNYAEISMWINAANSALIIIGGILILRKIKKQNKSGSLDKLWSDFAAKNKDELSRVIEKSLKGEPVSEKDYESR